MFEACQFLIPVLRLFSETVNKKWKESLWTSSTMALTYPHFVWTTEEAKPPKHCIIPSPIFRAL